jgi:hypothetical protein
MNKEYYIRRTEIFGEGWTDITIHGHILKAKDDYEKDEIAYVVEALNKIHANKYSFVDQSTYKPKYVEAMQRNQKQIIG